MLDITNKILMTSNAHMIEMMKFKGYLHLLENEIELILPHDEAVEKFPELYI